MQLRLRTGAAALAATAALVGAAGATAPAAVAAPATAGKAAASSCTYGSIGWYCGHYYATPQRSVTLSYGSSGAAVRELQDLIGSTTAYYAYHNQPLTVDGQFGPQTRSAVRWFQGHYMGKGAVDGIVGPKTWRELRG
ncbi:peptidoglycan-binding domain-containing protein [Streptomyces poriticola]|uniref:peptidoglycan-binding domain-containing protein n=1 Tax=Streptomyces poriticola TaxID=3120506 RepID=UPI002FCE1300